MIRMNHSLVFIEPYIYNLLTLEHRAFVLLNSDIFNLFTLERMIRMNHSLVFIKPYIYNLFTLERMIPYIYDDYFHIVRKWFALIIRSSLDGQN